MSMESTRNQRFVRRLLHPFVIAIVLPSSLSGSPNYPFQWFLVAAIGIPAVILASTPPEPTWSRQYRILGAAIAISAAVATIAGFWIGGNLSPASAGPLLVLIILLVATTKRTSALTAEDDRFAILLGGGFLVMIGTLQTLGVGPIWDVTQRLYSAHYPELIGYMRSRSEPVVTSATHSVAACVYALMSVAAAMASTSRGMHKRTVLALRVVSLLTWALILRLHGSTALISAGLLAGIFVLRATKTVARRMALTTTLVYQALLVLSMPVVVVVGLKFYELQRDYPSMGFTERFSSSGPYSELVRQGSRLLLGSGFVESPTFSYADSGFAKNLVRLGIIGTMLLACFYIVAYREMRQLTAQHRSGEARLAVVGILLLGLFEAGHEVLASPRLLPLAIAYLSVCRRQLRAEGSKRELLAAPLRGLSDDPRPTVGLPI
jgi:hypothetical protein